MADNPPAGSLYLLDAHGLIFQMFHGIGPMSAPDGRPTNAVFGVTRSLISLYDRGADYLISAHDDKEPTFRVNLDVNYKAHRPPPPDDLLIQEPMIEQILEAMRIPKLVLPGYEADDIMATVAKDGAARGLEVFLCTSDKDCRQLLSDKIRIMNLRKGEMFDSASLLADWGVRPDQVVDFQALVGDSVDNVPGVPGVGPKTAAKWLQQYDNLDNLIVHADELSGPKIKTAFKETVANGKLAISRDLVRLDQRVPLELQWEDWRRKDWDGQRLLELFQEFGFRGFAERVRSTLKSSGKKKNFDLLASIGEQPDAPTGVATTPDVPARRGQKARRDGAPSLFDAVAESGQAETPPTSADGWSYDKYELVDTWPKFEAFSLALSQQSRIAFDLETTSLESLRADIVGYAFCWNAGAAYYIPVRGPKEDPILDPAEVLAALRPVFENPAIAKVNQNIKYDLLVLAAQGVHVANVAGDSMIAHYLLHSGERSHNLDELARTELGHENIPISDLIGKGKSQVTIDTASTSRVKDYACEDADTAFRLAAKLEPLLEADGLRRLYDEVEIPLIEVLAELEFNGVRLDIPFLQKLSTEMQAQLAEMEKGIHTLAGRPVNIASPKQLREVLFDEMKLQVQKRTGTTGEASTDQESLERLAAQGHELPRKIIEHRQVAKLKGTYVDALPALVNPRTGRVHTSFNQTVASTGRLSSSDPNLQNVPTRTEQGRQIRRAFIPRDGWQILTADYSQIELRLLAHFCGDEALCRAFAEDKDVHASVAAQIFKIPESEVTSEQRGAAKTVNFGVIYGMSAFGLAVRLAIPRPDAEQFIQEYFARFPRVLAYQDNLLKTAKQNGYVRTILGRRRKFNMADSDVNSSFRNRTQAAREAINMEIQGSAADLMKLSMLAVYRRLKAEPFAAKMLLTVHDELVFEVPPDEREKLAALVRQEMTSAMKLEVPLKVDVAAGPNWLDVDDVPT